MSIGHEYRPYCLHMLWLENMPAAHHDSEVKGRWIPYVENPSCVERGCLKNVKSGKGLVDNIMQTCLMR